MHKLSPFKRIGWDFDDTLIGHPHSEAMWAFIERNPYEQEHFIITFRSGGMETRIMRDLLLAESPLDEGHFAGIHSIPHELWLEFHHPLHDGLPNSFMMLEDLVDDPYVNWKGKTCSELGIEVLVDDMTHNVIHGCKKHKVLHFHPDDLS